MRVLLSRKSSGCSARASTRPGISLMRWTLWLAAQLKGTGKLTRSVLQPNLPTRGGIGPPRSFHMLLSPTFSMHCASILCACSFHMLYSHLFSIYRVNILCVRSFHMLCSDAFSIHRVSIFCVGSFRVLFLRAFARVAKIVSPNCRRFFRQILACRRIIPLIIRRLAYKIGLVADSTQNSLRLPL